MPPSRRPPFLGPHDAVVLFDGVCNLCNGAVRFLLPRDPVGRLRFAALQSASGQTLLDWCGQPRERSDTMIFIERNRAYFRSTAVLRLTRYLRWPWPALAFLLVIPQPLRDWLYNRVARNRYALFGKTESCLMPSPEVKRRFLE